MPKESSVVADEVRARARGLEVYLGRVERLHAAGYMSSQDVERAYSGAYLEFHAFLEGSIERLFLGLLRGRLLAGNPAVRPLIAVRSDRVARDVVYGGRNYADWLPYDRTVRRAKAFFASGLPFSELPGVDRAVLEDSGVIRNAIAHISPSSMTRFEGRFVEGRFLPPWQRRPAGYLRGTHAAAQTRMSHLMASVVNVIRVLAS